MAGILDSKKRFIDLIVTQEGKRQIASGKMRAEYASLSDSQVYYQKNDVDGVDDRIYFQVMDSPNNVVVLEKDDTGKLIDYDFSPSGSIVGNDIFKQDPEITNFKSLIPDKSTGFSSTTNDILSSFTRHFNAQQILSNFERDGNEFELSTDRVNFAISNSVPFPEGPESETINVNDAEPFFTDSKLTHIDNFKFLPPKNVDGSDYGTFQDIRSRKRETLQDIIQSLGRQSFVDDGERKRRSTGAYRTDTIGDFDVINRRKLRSPDSSNFKQSQTVYFEKTSEENNLVMQIFENGPNSKMTKLDLIDAGSFIPTGPLAKISLYPEKRIFYAGKVFFDSFNTPTFINLFTIILE
jgi:hypothetical protein